jgi:hypothetical protein
MKPQSLTVENCSTWITRQTDRHHVEGHMEYSIKTTTENDRKETLPTASEVEELRPSECYLGLVISSSSHLTI